MPYYVDSIARWSKDGDKEQRPFWANRPTHQWKKRMVPLDLLRPELAAERAYREWAKEALDSEAERDEIGEQVSLLRQKFAMFNLPFMSLPVTTQKETALDVFIKMNTSGAPLSIYDIVVAQIEAAMSRSLHDLVSDIRADSPGIEAYYPADDLALYASALIQSREATKANYLTKDFGPQMLANWETLLRGVRRTLEFLEQERVLDAKRLPTDVVIPVLVALWGLAPDGLDAEGRARTLLRKYLWRAFFSSHYEKSTNSRTLSDFNEMKSLIEGKAGSPDILDDEKHPLPAAQELVGAAWPVRKDRLARAILALALRHGGLDLADGGGVTRANLKKREYHHLFPDAHLTRLRVPEEDIYLSLNCALVTWRTNRNIRDKDPERYLAQRRDGTDLGEAEVKARLATHLIPFDEMIAGDYQAFLDKRASMIHEAMTTLCTTGAS
jgi:hypothetical protein